VGDTQCLTHFGWGIGPNWFGFACLNEFKKIGKSQNICTKIDAAILLEFQLGAN